MMDRTTKRHHFVAVGFALLVENRQYVVHSCFVHALIVLLCNNSKSNNSVESRYNLAR